MERALQGIMMYQEGNCLHPIYEQFMVLGDAELSRRFSMQDEAEQKEEVKKALAAGVPKATILTYFYPEVSVERMSSYRKKH